MTDTATSPAEIIVLVDRLQAVLERVAEQQAEAIGLCERIELACDQALHHDAAWQYVALEVRTVRDVLPGGGSEGDPLHDFALVRELAEVAARRGT